MLDSNEKYSLWSAMIIFFSLSTAVQQMKLGSSILFISDLLRIAGAYVTLPASSVALILVASTYDIPVL